MATTSRMQLDHPDLDDAGGSALWTRVNALYQSLGDAAPGRYFQYSAITNSTVTTITHNLNVVLEELDVLIYTGNQPTLTRVDDLVNSGWVVATSAGNLNSQIKVTAPSSGGPWTFAVVILNTRALVSNLVELAATPSNPPSGRHRKYFKTDGFQYSLNSAGTEKRDANTTDSQSFAGVQTMQNGLFHSSTLSDDPTLTSINGVMINPTVPTGHTVTVPTASTLAILGGMILSGTGSLVIQSTGSVRII